MQGLEEMPGIACVSTLQEEQVFQKKDSRLSSLIL